MAKFKNSNLQLKTNQQIQLGDSQETLITYDGSNLSLNPSSGAVELYFDGSKTFESVANGAKFGSTTGGRITQTGSAGASTLALTSLEHGGIVQMRGENNAGADTKLFEGDPDADAKFYYAGNQKLSTLVEGIQVKGSSGTINVGFSGTTYRFLGVNHGWSYDFIGEDAGGVQRSVITGNPDGAAGLYYTGDLKLSTDSTGVIVTGDLEVTGTATASDAVDANDLTTKSYVDQVAYVDSTQVVVVHDHSDLDTGGFIEQREQYVVQFQTDRAAPPWKEGRVFWDSNNHAFAVYNDEPEITLQVGQEVFVRVRNNSGVLIPNGAVVSLVGASEGLPAVVLADARDPSLMVATAIATHSIENNTNGYVTYVGAVNDVDTSQFSSGDLLYVSATTPGGITNIRPNSPNVGHRIGVATVDSTSGQIVVASHPADDPMEVMNFNMPLSGVTANTVELTGTLREVAAGATGDITTDWSVNNQHFYMYVNTIDGSGVVTITGVSVGESSGTPVLADTETITVDVATEYYQSSKKWWEITNIDIPGEISAINYDYGAMGYSDMGNRNFRIIGYRCEALASGINADFSLIIQKFKDDGSKKASIVELESIGVDSNAAGDVIIDNLRTGGDDRSLDPASTLFASGTQIVFKQLDFSDYFTSDENVVLGRDGNEGFYIRVEGSPLGTGIANVSFINMYLYYELL